MESNLEPKNLFAWTTFYTEFADRLLQYKDNRSELLILIKEVFDKDNPIELKR